MPRTKNLDLQIALSLATSALELIATPKRPDGTWKKYQTNHPSDRQLKNWYPGHTGIGFVCGAVSGGLELFEFDEDLYDEFKATADAVAFEAAATAESAVVFMMCTRAPALISRPPTSSVANDLTLRLAVIISISVQDLLEIYLLCGLVALSTARPPKFEAPRSTFVDV